MTDQIFFAKMLIISSRIFSKRSFVRAWSEQHSFSTKATPKSSSSQPAEATDENFDEILKNHKGPLIVDFYANWCGPCKMIAPILSRVSASTGVKLIKVDTDVAQKTAGKFEIASLPTIVGFNGHKEVDRFIGMKDEKSITKFVEGLKGK